MLPYLIEFLKPFIIGAIDCSNSCEICGYCYSFANKIVIDKNWQKKFEEVVQMELSTRYSSVKGV